MCITSEIRYQLTRDDPLRGWNVNSQFCIFFFLSFCCSPGKNLKEEKFKQSLYTDQIFDGNQYNFSTADWNIVLKI